MKKMTQLFGILMLAFLMTTAVQAQDAVTLDEILENYFENIGGEENWKKITSMKMTGSSSMQGLDVAVSKAFDGETAWMINPFAGGEEPTKLDEEQSKQFKKQKFQDEFIDYAGKGHTVELDGTEEVDGTETYKIKMTKKEGDVVFYFFDTENFVPIMVRGFVDAGPAKGQATETFMSDYQEVDGLMIAHTTEQKVGGATAFSFTADEIELNAEDMKAKTFAFPSETAEEK